MNERTPSRKLKDFIGLPNGREEWAQYILDIEKRSAEPDPLFTDAESAELYGMQYDMAVKLREFDRKLVTQEEYSSFEKTNNEIIAQIERVARERRRKQLQPQSTKPLKSLEDSGTTT